MMRAIRYRYFARSAPGIVDQTDSYARRAALDNLAKLRRDFDVYGEGGFFDAVNVDTGQVSRYWLALDQGMIMAAIANELTGDRLQRYFTRGAVEEAIRPLLAMEEFTAGG